MLCNSYAVLRFSVLALDSRNKGSSVPFLRIPAVDEDCSGPVSDFPVAGISVLSSLQYLDTVGWMRGRTSGL